MISNYQVPIVNQRYRNPMQQSHNKIGKAIPGLSNLISFFELLRRVERTGWLPVRLGAADDRQYIQLRVIQPADMSFASRELASVEQYPAQSHALPKLEIVCRHFGLFSPYGPLPIHITDHARQEVLVHRNAAFQEFSSILSQRLAVLHYRAWSQLNVALCHEKPQFDSFLHRLQQIAGISRAHQKEQTHVMRMRTYYAAACLPGRGSLKQLQKILCSYFGVEMLVERHHAKWVDDGKGSIYQRMGRLGTTRIGKRFFDVQHSARVVVGPLEAPEYLNFMRGSERLKALLEMCQDFTAYQLVFDVDLLIKTQPSMSGHLGCKRLGRDSWMKTGYAIYKKNLYRQSA